MCPRPRGRSSHRRCRKTPFRAASSRDRGGGAGDATLPALTNVHGSGGAGSPAQRLREQCCLPVGHPWPPPPLRPTAGVPAHRPLPPPFLHPFPHHGRADAWRLLRHCCRRHEGCDTSGGRRRGRPAAAAVAEPRRGRLTGGARTGAEPRCGRVAGRGAFVRWGPPCFCFLLHVPVRPSACALSPPSPFLPRATARCSCFPAPPRHGSSSRAGGCFPARLPRQLSPCGRTGHPPPSHRACAGGEPCLAANVVLVCKGLYRQGRQPLSSVSRFCGGGRKDAGAGRGGAVAVLHEYFLARLGRRPHTGPRG